MYNMFRLGFCLIKKKKKKKKKKECCLGEMTFLDSTIRYVPESLETPSSRNDCVLAVVVWAFSGTRYHRSDDPLKPVVVVVDTPLSTHPPSKVCHKWLLAHALCSNECAIFLFKFPRRKTMFYELFSAPSITNDGVSSLLLIIFF